MQDTTLEARLRQLQLLREETRAKTNQVPGALQQSILEFEQEVLRQKQLSSSSSMGENQSKPVPEPQHTADSAAYNAGKVAGKVEYYAGAARDGAAEAGAAVRDSAASARDAAAARANEVADSARDGYYTGKRNLNENVSWAADATRERAAAARNAASETTYEAGEAAARAADAARRNAAAARDTVVEDVNWAADAAARKAQAAKDATLDATHKVADGTKRNFGAGREAAHENLEWASQAARDEAQRLKDATADATRRVTDTAQSAAEATADGIARAGQATKETVQAVPGAVVQGAGGLYGLGESVVGTLVAPVKSAAGWFSDKTHNAIDSATREKDRLAAEARLGKRDGYKESADNVRIHRDLPDGYAHEHRYGNGYSDGDAHARLSYNQRYSDGVSNKPGVDLSDPSQAAGEADLAPVPFGTARYTSKGPFSTKSYDTWASGRTSASTIVPGPLVTAAPIVPYTSSQEIFAARRRGYSGL